MLQHPASPLILHHATNALSFYPGLSIRLSVNENYFS